MVLNDLLFEYIGNIDVPTTENFMPKIVTFHKYFCVMVLIIVHLSVTNFTIPVKSCCIWYLSTECF